MRIEKLTAEQEARMAEWRENWTRIGLCTEPANRAKAERGVGLAYAAANLPAPRIVWCDSPLSQALTRSIVLELIKNKKLWDSVWDSVRASVGASVRASVWDSVGDSVWASVGDSVRDSVGDSGYGQHDANWIAFYNFFREVCSLKEQTEKLEGLTLLTQNAGWYLPHQEICWVSERHNVCKRDDRGRLHCEDGPALAYPDKWAIYAWHGVRVSYRVIEHSEDLTVGEIQQETNAEVRRVMVERYGLPRFLMDSGAQKLAEDEFGELYRTEIPNDEPLIMVKVMNSTPESDGSSKPYFLRVQPELRPLLSDGLGNAQKISALNAVASTFGMTGEQYLKSLVEQT
jgi:hypothetical protein